MMMRFEPLMRISIRYEVEKAMKLRLKFLKVLNLELLASLGEDAVLKLCTLHAHKPCRQRCLRFPSHKELKKSMGHYLYSRVLAGEPWEKIKGELKKKGSLRSLGLTFTDVKRNYHQFEKELKREQAKEAKKQ
jgi:hypothetical protein